LDTVTTLINNKVIPNVFIDVYAENGDERHRLVISNRQVTDTPMDMVRGPYLILAGNKGNMYKKMVAYVSDDEPVSSSHRHQLFKHAIENCTSTPAELSIVKRQLGTIELDVNGVEESICMELINVFPGDSGYTNGAVPIGSLLSGECESTTPHLVLTELWKLMESTSPNLTAYWTQNTLFQLANFSVKHQSILFGMGIGKSTDTPYFLQ